MTEKKFTYILVSLALVAILVVIMLNVPWGGDKAKISKEFGNLDTDHVYETIDFDSVLDKIEAGDTFQLFVGSSETVNDKSFAYEANKLAKEYDVETVYYLNLFSLTEAELVMLTYDITASHQGTFPSLYYFQSEGETSFALNISGLKNFDDFGRNWNLLLTQYFEECYNN